AAASGQEGPIAAAAASGELVVLMAVRAWVMRLAMRSSSALEEPILPPGKNIMATPTVDVSTLATGGTGTSGSPYTGWDAPANWTNQRDYYFPQAYYQASQTINLALGSRVRGAGRKMSVVQTTSSF